MVSRRGVLSGTGGTLRGTVKRDDGIPVEGAVVIASPHNDDGFSGPPAVNRPCSPRHSSDPTVERDSSTGSGTASPGSSASRMPLSRAIASSWSTPYGQ